ncbi:hypothetical protein NWO25_18820 [Enterococcus lactis]|nr:hypothetical protein [Enterococcus lactis]
MNKRQKKKQFLKRLIANGVIYDWVLVEKIVKEPKTRVRRLAKLKLELIESYM